jgi:PAS domain S-box-containing protein
MFIAALGGVTAGLAAVTLAMPSPTRVQWSAAPGLFVVMTAAAWLILRVTYRGQTMALDLFEAALAPAIIAFPGVVVIAFAFGAQVIANAIRRNTFTKGAFNVLQWTSAAATGSLVYHSITSGPVLGARSISALLAAMAAVALVNMFAFTYVIHLAERRPAAQVATSLVASIAFSALVNIAFGMLFVVAYRGSALGALLFLVPLGALGLSYRGYAAAVADRARLTRMIDANRELHAPVDPREALPTFVDRVRACFDAETAELVLIHGGGRHVYRATSDGTYARVEVSEGGSLGAELLRRAQVVRTSASRADGPLRALLQRDGHRNVLASPVIAEGAVLGVLCVYDHSGPSGWEEGEIAVLQTLAGEAGAAVRKGELVADIIGEREKLSAIVGNTSDGIVMLDASGQILVWNPGFEAMTGWSADAMLATRSLDRLRVRTEGDEDVSLTRWTQTESIPQSIQITKANGETASLLCTYGRVDDGGGRPALFIAIARDVTKARELDRLKDDFIATVSHELRTPLTPIIGWVEMLIGYGDRLEPEQRDQALQSIKRKSEHLQQLIFNLLEVSKLEAGSPMSLNTAVEAGELATRVVEDLRAANPTRAIVLDIEGGPLSFWGDGVSATQILTNLVSNALNYSPEHAPVRVVARRGKDIELSVVDEGPGIAREDQDRIFERFHRLGDHMTRTTGGTGLGLYIARRLAERLDGTISVDSTPGHGATFTLRVPAATLTTVA